MVIKPEEAKKKAEESEQAHVKYRARNLEEVLDRDLKEAVQRRLSRAYIQYADIKSSDPLYEKIMDTVIQDYRNAGWEADYKEEKWDNGYVVKTRITLKIGKDVTAKSEGNILPAKTVEQRVLAYEETEANKHEAKIDATLVNRCSEKAVWYCIKEIEEGVRDMLLERYAAAGWKVSVKERYDQTRDWRQEKNKYLVFERE
ncbi:MAG: hypothetical protein WC852_00840 [Candidatus Nanoarchaeia archaeon]